LRKPDNSLYPLTENLVRTEHLYMWKISQPNPGAWRLTTSNLSDGFHHDVQIQGKTNISCYSTLQKEMEPDQDSSGYTLLTSEPIIDSDLLILTTCDDLQFTNANISLIDPSGNILVSYSPIELNQLGILTKVRIPREQFRIQTIITLLNGNKIQRIEKQLISPTIFAIELTNQPYIASPGETIKMNYTIKSALSDQVTIRLQLIDTLKLLGNDGMVINLTFIKETSGMSSITLPKDYRQQQLTTDLVIFSVSTENNRTKQFSYENDEIVSVYLEFNSASVVKSINYIIISVLLLMYHMHS
jgi:hypothetical protein